jgi:hypothetical protein
MRRVSQSIRTANHVLGLIIVVVMVASVTDNTIGVKLLDKSSRTRRR